MKEYHILIACGSGIATSTVIANRVKNLCEDNGFKVKVPSPFLSIYLIYPG